MPTLITPSLSISFSDIALANSIPFDEFSQKIVRIIRNWQEGKVFEMLTSGSTGVPKKIILDREAMKASALQSIHAFGLRSTDTLLCCLSTEHIAGLMMVIRAVVLGADLIVIPPDSNPLENSLLGQQPGLRQAQPPGTLGPDFAALVPMQLENSLNNPFLNNLKSIIVGGAPISDSLAEKIKALKVPVYQTYGMTETYTHVALKKLNGADASDNYFALEGIHFTKDERDCLVIHAAAIKIDALVTNDVVELIDETHFKWLGRFDNVINSGGIKIQLEKIEKAAESVLAEINKSGISLFATGIKDEKLGEKLVLIFESGILDDEQMDSFKKIISGKLSTYEIPKEYYFIREFKRTALGKIDRIGTLGNVIIC